MDPSEAAVAVARAFALEPLDRRLATGEAVTLDEVRAYLVEHVGRMLDQSPALLMSILYRIDVAERDVKQVFAEESPPAIPARLADLILERQLQKLRLREQYRAQEGSDDARGPAPD